MIIYTYLVLFVQNFQTSSEMGLSIITLDI